MSFKKLKEIEFTFNINLIKGTELVSTDINGVSDPMVKSKKLNNKVICTKKDNVEIIKTSSTKKKTLEPIWNEEFFIPISVNENGKTTDELRIEVYDIDFSVLGKKEVSEFMGVIHFDLNNFPMSTTIKKWFDLKNVSTGKLFLELTTENFGLTNGYKEENLIKTDIPNLQIFLEKFNLFNSENFTELVIYL
jgi:hypothetical protein